MTTYTVTVDNAANLLAVCVADGDHAGFVRETREYCEQCSPDHEPDLTTTRGVILTDELPDDDARIVWQGHDGERRRRGHLALRDKGGMTSAGLIRELGEALYGAHPESALAEALAVNRRTVRRWRVGDTEPAAGVWRELSGLVRARQAELARLAAALGRRV